MHTPHLNSIESDKPFCTAVETITVRYSVIDIDPNVDERQFLLA